MSLQASTLATAGILLAALLDCCIGDPATWLHPVIVMGWGIQRMRLRAETWAQDSPIRLSIAGLIITFTLVLTSGLCGWLLDQLVLGRWGGSHDWINLAARVLWVIALASALASKSLEESVHSVLVALPADDGVEPLEARRRLSWIVGRDTTSLNRNDILRAAAETASENAVDGLFAPLFWMLVGAGLWMSGFTAGPGPLALAWIFKAASTLDSMLGYRRGTLRWLGTAGARLDDLLTWLPCRLVMLSLPLVSRSWLQWSALVSSAESEGRHDASPNAGRSEAIYAHCAGVQLGGRNRYGNRWVEKPLLGAEFPVADVLSVKRIMGLTKRLELLWLLMAASFSWAH